MKLQYFAYLRDVTGLSEEIYTAPAATLGDLMITLVKRYGNNFKKWVLTPEGELCDIAIILVNGNDARHTGRLATPLAPDDLVSIFPPVAGG
jgi:sulfur-carrier protein